MDLRPVTYNVILKDDDRVHNGFIAQEVEEAMNKHGISYDEFAALCKNSFNDEEEENIPMQILNDEEDPDNMEYSLSYGEFTSLNTHMIQKALRLIEEQQKKINELENIIKNL